MNEYEIPFTIHVIVRGIFIDLEPELLHRGTLVGWNLNYCKAYF